MHDSKIITVLGYNALLYVERGHLVIKDGFPNEGKTVRSVFPEDDLPSTDRYTCPGWVRRDSRN